MFDYILTTHDGARSAMASGDAMDYLEKYSETDGVSLVEAAAQCDLSIVVDPLIEDLNVDELTRAEMVNILQADYDDDLTADEWSIVIDYYRLNRWSGSDPFDPATLKDEAMEAMVLPIGDTESDTHYEVGEYVADGACIFEGCTNDDVTMYFDYEKYGRDQFLGGYMSKGERFIFWNR